MFISFEGIDGSGKSTIAKLVGEKLKSEGYETVLTREPGGVKIAEDIRAIILDKNNVNLTHQEVVVNKNYEIKSVAVLDEEGNAGIKVTFKSIDMKAKFDDDYFVLEENMQTFSQTEEETELQMNELDEAIYPMYLPEGTYLETEKTVELDQGSRIILTFAGTTPFMLVEEPVSKEEEMTVIPTSGDLDIFMDTIAIVDDSSISWSSAGVDYYLVSSEMSSSDLLNVAKSISALPINK